MEIGGVQLWLYIWTINKQNSIKRISYWIVEVNEELENLRSMYKLADLGDIKGKY